MLSIIFMWNFNIIPIFIIWSFLEKFWEKISVIFNQLFALWSYFFLLSVKLLHFWLKYWKRNIWILYWSDSIEIVTKFFRWNSKKKILYYHSKRLERRSNGLMKWISHSPNSLACFFFTKIMLNERILNWDFKVDMFVCRKKKAKTWKSIEWIAEGFWHGNWKDWKQKKCSSEIF